MDYGKEAYALASELERRMSGAGAAFKAASTVFAGACPAAQTTNVAEYTGGAALLVLTVVSDGEGGCDVLMNGVKAGVVRAGGAFPCVFAAEGAGTVALRPDDGVTVRSVTLSAAGTDCAFVSASAPFAADAVYGVVYGLENADGLRLSRLTAAGPTPLAVFAEAEDFDVAACDEGALVAACAKGNGELCLVADGLVRHSAVIGDCLRIAAAFTGDGFVVAAYDGRKVRVTGYTADLTPLESTRAHASSTVDKLALVKGAAFPTLALGDGGKILVRRAAAETLARGRVACDVALSGAQV